MLNPVLYRRLTAFTGQAVRISRENERCVSRTFKDPKTNKWVQSNLDSGEEYISCCPFCGDKNYHLYVNYRYGSRDLISGTVRTRLACCFHGCLEKEENRRKLYEALCVGNVCSVDPVVVMETVSNSVPSFSEISPPGNLTLVADLEEDHPAVKYLCHDRGYSRELLREYDIAYCESSHYKSASNRIIIPIVFQGKYRGWQARSIGNPKFGPKYFTAPGLKKSCLIYNFDRASKCPYPVIMEGATDVWRVGEAGICLFGKTISERQLSLVQQTWRKAIVLLDPDAEKEAKSLCNKLRSASVLTSMVTLPTGVDPGSSDRNYLFSIITKEAELCR